MLSRLWRPCASAISYHPKEIIIYGAAIRAERRDIEALHYRANLLPQSPDISIDSKPIRMRLICVYITPRLRVLAEARGTEIVPYEPRWIRGEHENNS